MALLVLIIISGLISLIALLVAVAREEKRGTSIGFCVASGLLAIILLVAGSLVSVPVGKVAVMSRLGRVTGQILDSGLKGKNIIDTAHLLSVQTQLFADDATAASKDLQDVTATIAINYKLDPSEAATVFRTIGVDYIKVVAHPLVQETVKEVTARYNAEDMILKRQEVKEAIATALKKGLAERGIISEAVNITNFKFSASFEGAIEAKVVAVQKVLEAENKLRQVEVEARQAEQRAKGEAAALIANAEGKAKSIQIVTDAQVEANKKLNATLNDMILRYIMLDRLGGNIQLWVVPDGTNMVLPSKP